MEASPRLQLVNMDVTQPSHVEMAVRSDNCLHFTILIRDGKTVMTYFVSRYIEESLPQHCSGLWAVINNAGMIQKMWSTVT